MKTYKQFMKEAYGNTDADFERKIGYDPRTDKERAIDKSWKTVDKPVKKVKKLKTENTDADFERKTGYDPRSDRERAIDKSWKTIDKPVKSKKKVTEAISSKGVNHQILSKHGFEAGAPDHYVHKSGQEVNLHGKTGWVSKPANRSAKGDAASKWAGGTKSTGLARHLKKNFTESVDELNEGSRRVGFGPNKSAKMTDMHHNLSKHGFKYSHTDGGDDRSPVAVRHYQHPDHKTNIAIRHEKDSGRTTWGHTKELGKMNLVHGNSDYEAGHDKTRSMHGYLNKLHKTKHQY